ncbi:unnamed protein product [Adineta steineri]|uniref:Uncharacterized protein n=1 Tax=Adineta steineri TaxID=433720 RepID=A0A814T5C1_9BILA|nr:unnamed protein product [Adineta steineri]
MDFINYLTQYNSYGGGYLNREKLELNSNDLINLIETIQIKYIKLHSNSTVQQIYPSNSISIPLNSERFLLVGQIPNPLPNSIQLELEFSLNTQNSRVSITLDIPLNESNHFGLIRRLWAQQKLNELNAFKDKYKSDILSLGLEYSLVSQFTSLLVLESLQQHLQYHICPAKTRLALYNQYMQYKTKENDQKTNNLSQLLQQWNQKCQWYDRIITDIDRHRAYLPRNTVTPHPHSQLFAFAAPTPSPVVRFGAATNTATVPTFAFGAPTSVTTSSPFGFGAATTSTAPLGGFKLGATPPAMNSNTFSSTIFGSSSQQQQISTSTNVSKESSLSKTEESSTIHINEYNPQSSYITRLSSSNDRNSAYAIYLDERTLNRQSASFYFDIASYFFSTKSFSSILDQFNQKQEIIQTTDHKSIEYGLRILTNILELELESPQLYRTVAYKLMELQQWNLALSICRKIYLLRSDEPQSLRDLALVLIELGEYNQALEYLKQILTQIWDERFQTIQTIVLLDLNRLLILMNQTTPVIDFRFVRHLPVDIRIVIQWDTPDTLIQLSIKEPTGQVCCNHNGSSQTDIGGYITKISFQSPYPVEYLLRQAIDGIYSISLTYLRNAQHTLTGVTTVLVYIYKYFGSINEEKQIQTVRLTDYNQTIDVGQIEFGNSDLAKLKDELQKTKDECHRLQNQLMINKLQPIQSSIQHLNVTCDGCFTTPIIVSPTTLTTDRRHSHFNRISTVNNQSRTTQEQNSDEDDDDNESVSTQSTQAVSLTSFIHTTATTTTNDMNLSLRQTRQRMHTNENTNNTTWSTRTRYSTRSTASNRNLNENSNDRQQQQSSSARTLSPSDDDDDDDNDISSNSKRNRMERSDRRISSVNRPNYKIDSDEHEDEDDDDDEDDDNQQKTNTTVDHQEDMEQTEKDDDKATDKVDDEDYEPSAALEEDEEEEEEDEDNDVVSARKKDDDDDSDSDFQLDGPSQHRRTNTNGNRVRKLRSTTNRPSPPLPNQNNKRKRSTVRTRSSTESDTTDSHANQTYKTRTRSRRRITGNKKPSLQEDFTDDDDDEDQDEEEDENRRRPRTTQATRVSKRGRVLKQRLLSE